MIFSFRQTPPSTLLTKDSEISTKRLLNGSSVSKRSSPNWMPLYVNHAIIRLKFTRSAPRTRKASSNSRLSNAKTRTCQVPKQTCFFRFFITTLKTTVYNPHFYFWRRDRWSYRSTDNRRQNSSWAQQSQEEGRARNWRAESRPWGSRRSSWAWRGLIKI